MAETVQTVLTGLVLAFVFRAFFVEPFIIPSGSMADTLLGAHATRTCPVCGWEFDFAPLRSGLPVGQDFTCPVEAVCPNCQSWIDLRGPTSPAVPKAGDRILVHKWAYALDGPWRPKRWDVIVFRDPADPNQHYIKRLVGLPGETVEIVDGDVFLDGKIARKPPDVQRSLWFVVYDQAHVPDPAAPAGHRPRWVAAEPPNAEGAGWTGLTARVIRYEGLDSALRKIVFDPDAGPEYLRDLYAFNRQSSGALVGDVRLTCELLLRAGDGLCQWELTRPPWCFLAELHRDGAVCLNIQSPDQAVVLHGTLGRRLPTNRPIAVEFGHVDYRAYLSIDGNQVLSTDDQCYTPRLDTLRADCRQRPVVLAIAAQNLRLELRRLRIDRDVHYVSRGARMQRAGPGQPFSLRAGEYFVLGDNSPDSHDSREWTEVGPHLPPDYRAGTVRADQIVGRAAFVYLPGLLPLDRNGRWFLPDLGRLRFVR